MHCWRLCVHPHTAAKIPVFMPVWSQTVPSPHFLGAIMRSLVCIGAEARHY